MQSLKRIKKYLLFFTKHLFVEFQATRSILLQLEGEALGAQSVAQASAYLEEHKIGESTRKKLATLSLNDKKVDKESRKLLVDRLGEFDAGDSTNHYVQAPPFFICP